MFTTEQVNHIKQGVTGITASAAGVGVSLLEVIEQWLRLGSLVVGIIIGLITLYNLTIGKSDK